MKLQPILSSSKILIILTLMLFKLIISIANSSCFYSSPSQLALSIICIIFKLFFIHGLSTLYSIHHFNFRIKTIHLHSVTHGTSCPLCPLINLPAILISGERRSSSRFNDHLSWMLKAWIILETPRRIKLKLCY